MINRLAGILLFSAISFTAISQTTTETKKTVARPDIPGAFTIELGLNRGLHAPDNFNIGLWGSRTINIYYQYEMRIMKSKFSFVPGIGLSLERFKLVENDLLSFAKVDGIYTNPVLNFDSLVIYPPAVHKFPGLKKSQIVTNYVEVPLELRYTLNPDDPARSFKISIGGRVGYLYDEFNKLKYRQNGDTKQLKDKQNMNLNRFRYGVFAKLGFGSFSLFGYYNLSSMFESNNGIYYNGQRYDDMNTLTAGISLSSF
jgi:hypothetical protein